MLLSWRFPICWVLYFTGYSILYALSLLLAQPPQSQSSRRALLQPSSTHHTWIPPLTTVYSLKEQPLSVTICTSNYFQHLLPLSALNIPSQGWEITNPTMVPWIISTVISLVLSMKASIIEDCSPLGTLNWTCKCYLLLILLPLCQALLHLFGLLLVSSAHKCR